MREHLRKLPRPRSIGRVTRAPKLGAQWQTDHWASKRPTNAGMPDRPPIAEYLDLARHPEGGWFRQTFKSDDHVSVVRNGRQTSRSAATLINFLLAAGESSGWHVVASTEIWIWQGPGTIDLQFGGNGEEPDDRQPVHRLGPDFAAGHMAQLTVPPGIWQRTLPSDEDALASCLVSPGFEFDDFRMADAVNTFTAMAQSASDPTTSHDTR